MRAEQRWYAGAALGSLLVLVIGYFLMISPEKSDAESLRGQTATILTQNLANRNRINKLQAENQKLSQYKATLTHQQLALPSSPALSDFIRELQVAATTSGVHLTATSIGASTTASTGGGTASGSGATTTSGTAASAVSGALSSISVGVTASGETTQLQSFLDQLQNQSARAVLVTGASIKALGANGASIDGASTLIASLEIFVSPSLTTQSEGN